MAVAVFFASSTHEQRLGSFSCFRPGLARWRIRGGEIKGGAQGTPWLVFFVLQPNSSYPASVQRSLSVRSMNPSVYIETSVIGYLTS